MRLLNLVSSASAGSCLQGVATSISLNFLRNNREVLPEFSDRNDEIQFFKELEFWKVPCRTEDANYVQKLRLDHSWREMRMKEMNENS